MFRVKARNKKAFLKNRKGKIIQFNSCGELVYFLGCYYTDLFPELYKKENDSRKFVKASSEEEFNFHDKLKEEYFYYKRIFK